MRVKRKLSFEHAKYVFSIDKTVSKVFLFDLDDEETPVGMAYLSSDTKGFGEPTFWTFKRTKNFPYEQVVVDMNPEEYEKYVRDGTKLFDCKISDGFELNRENIDEKLEELEN